nr:peptidoglycan DD-metalloendopeptidase family protein [Azospirillum oleiclasticum]
MSAGGAIIVVKGDSLYSLSRKYNVPLRDLAEANRLSPPYTLDIGQRLVLPASRQYIVQRGDTLYGISRMFGVDVSELTRVNNLSAPFAVQAGQPLRLPGAGGTTATAEAPKPATRGSVQVSELSPPPGNAAAAKPVTVTPAPASPAPAAGAPAAAAVTPPAASGTAAATGFEPGREPKPLRPPSKPATATESAPAVAAGAPVQLKPPTPPTAAEGARPAEPEVAAAPAAPPKEVGKPPPRAGTRFLWPVKGKLVSGYGPKPDGMHNDGINIAAAKGTPVVAADNGVVAYSGNELRGFGNLLLVRHSDGFITAYAHLDTMKVERGATVKRGQVIGTVGQTGAVSSPQLHFELRKGSQAVDPDGHLDPAGGKVTGAAFPDGQPGPG